LADLLVYENICMITNKAYFSDITVKKTFIKKECYPQDDAKASWH